MEVKFPKADISYLRTLITQNRSQELTQELRIPDSLPDIGRVLGCWGQTVIRSKEWQSNCVNVSGGVLIWCLYSPEEGTEVHTAETWMPFQETWEFQGSSRDGWIYAFPSIESLDARCTSARKLMIRCTLSMFGEAMVSEDAAVYVPDELPADIELLCKSYPLEIPAESGEKQFQIEEMLTITGGKPSVNRIIAANTNLEIHESRVMTNKLVFRGDAHLRIVYLDAESNIQHCQWKQPFSQLADLDKDYENDASVWFCPVLTGQDVTITEDGQVQYRCGAAAQYIVYCKKMLSVVEDGYSNKRPLNLHVEDLKIPVRLDVCQDRVDLHTTLNEGYSDIYSASCQCCYSVRNYQNDASKLEITGQFQMICRDENEMLQGMVMRQSNELCIQSDYGNRVRVAIRNAGDAVVDSDSNGLTVKQTVDVDTEILKEQVFNMISGLEISETEIYNKNGPSIILKRVNNESLWDIAKECKSSVALIKDANGLENECNLGERILLIPVR